MKKMKIGMEARWIAANNTGFGNYAHNLLLELGKIDDSNEYVIYLNRPWNKPTLTAPNFKVAVLKGNNPTYKHFYLPIDVALKSKVDLFHFPYNAPSLFFPRPYILTITDMSYRHIPSMLKMKHRMSLNVQLAINARHAKKIIVISENTKKDIMRFLNIPEEKIEVIYLGVNDSYKIIQEPAIKNKVMSAYKLPEKFILYVGTYLPHKNLETLLQAFRILKTEHNIPHCLVFAGNKGRNFEEIAKSIHALGLDEYVKCIGFVDDAYLPVLYNLCDLFVFPSLYEGFGLTLLEAMACGAPVISSDSSCLTEVGGDAALYFSQKDFQKLAKNMHEALTNEDLRKHMINSGLRRIESFSWRSTANKTLKMYETVYENLKKR
jgi:glycosyltransferase involved in cell wall biosynthesis